jgi:hypothetical protein
MGNLPHWAQFGGAICTPILGPWATDPKRAQFWGGAIFTPPILGPFGVTCPFFSFGPLSISGSTLHQRIPYLWLANPPTAREQPIPNTGGPHKRHPTYQPHLNHTADHLSRGVNTDGARPTSSLRYLKSEYSRAGSQKFPVSTSFYITFFTVLPNGLTTHSLHTTRIPNLWHAGHIHHRHPKPYYYCRSPIQGRLTSTVTPTPMKLKN